MKSYALEISDLSKVYSNGTQALNGISFTVQQGDFFALLGPNGAGKSTTIGIITSLIRKTSGKVIVYGYDLDKNIQRVKEFIGVVPQEFNFNIFETVENILFNQAGYYGLSRITVKNRVEHYLKKLGLWEKRKHKALALSGGMKRRLMIARALIHEPKLLILDEPTAGVDIELRRSMWDFLTDLNRQGVTIILTTHYLEEAETLCRNIAIIDHGKIVRNTQMRSLLRELESEKFVLDLAEPLDDDLTDNNFKIVKLDNETLELSVPRGQTINEIFSYLSEKNIKVTSLRNKTNRLEELFLGLTKREVDNAN
jgi:ABC-2 type transport system ATP-binding protein